ncbi:hypothetical protein FRC03_009834 [Tulasnella sp. 419]|nr:hypothetical protein FRC02_008330 [Tulasnella sp. 418]KAG8957762.1 hypothetical protein FRC03_009834 [Tulasnella sp. 419]
MSAPETTKDHTDHSERKLHTKPKKTRKESADLSPVYHGLAMRVLKNPDRMEYAVVIHDGMGVVGTEHDTIWGTPQEATNQLIDRAKEYCRNRGHRIELYAVAGPLDDPLNWPKPSLDVDRDRPLSFLARIWLELDAIPFVIPCRDTQFSMEGEAVRAIEGALATLHPTSSAIVKASCSHDDREVEVDADNKVHLNDVNQQAALTSPRLWDLFISTGHALKQNKIKVAFFSATPQGGGVALMRHALIRLWRGVGLDFHWYVPKGDSAVFDVTKRRFHNVLQGVNPPGVTLRDEDKQLFEKWTRFNYEKYWKNAVKADVIIIDDPQLTALIPIIRKQSPNTKIIYRSHIQVRSDLIDQKISPAYDVWSYLFEFIKQTDLFVSHPVAEFVPQVVRDALPVVYMPPSTDPLDGLNKPILEEHLATYRHFFNELMHKSTGQQLNWKRGYVLQVARFDPSKGIPYLIEGYKLFREKIKGSRPLEKTPQLVLTGHSSIDDPDGTLIIHQIQDTLATPEYADVKDDIFAVRAPPDDRLLDAMMRGCDVACQVSTREGFEIKVTEAVHKTRWIIATQAGGIPLQVRDGRDGRLVPPADPQGICDALVEFYSSGKEQATGEIRGNDINKPLGGRWDEDGDGPREELFTVGNATMWHYLCCSVLGLTKDQVRGIPQKNQETLQAIKLDTPKNLYKLNNKKVWDMVSGADVPTA